MRDDDDVLDGMGKILEFKLLALKPSSSKTADTARSSSSPSPGIQVRWLGDFEELGWSKDELERGYAVRQVDECLGGGVGIAVKRGIKPASNDPILLLSVKVFDAIDDAVAKMVYAARRYETAKWKEGATRVVETSALGQGAQWALVRAERDGVTWWEIHKNGVVSENGIDDWRQPVEREVMAREFRRAAHGDFLCGAYVRIDEYQDEHGRVWGHSPRGRPCRRRARHPGHHRNKDGVEWSSWPRVVADAAKVVPIGAGSEAEKGDD